MPSTPLTIAIVGAGHRSLGYAKYAKSHPERMKIVAVAEPNDVRRAAVARDFDLPKDMQFRSYEELLGRPPVAAAVINGTMDRHHYASALPLLETGYHMLLEKPIATAEGEVRGLVAAAKKHGRIVMICHVLRYAPFYAKIKELLDAGEIGDVTSLHSAENVSYHHMAVGFIRGRWNSSQKSAPMLLAKCSHDLDIIAWLMSGIPAARVASFGSLKHFKKEHAPAGSAARCLDSCQIESTCEYSARANYIEQGLWKTYAWESIEHIPNPTVEQKLESLRTTNPFGRCVWHCDNDVVDHQSVLVEFANGATASHDLFCATARACRTIHVCGTKGEILGDMEAGDLRVRKPHAVKGSEYTETRISLETSAGGDGHGGGDALLVEDFVRVMLGEPASKGTTRIEDSLNGHLIAFAADRAMLGRRVVEIE